MSNDPLSDALRLIEAQSVVSGGFSVGGTWAIRFPPPQWSKFAAVSKGSCWLRVDGQRKAVRLEEGDVFVLSGHHGFVIGSSLEARPRDFREVFGEGGRFVNLGGGADCVVLAGQVLFHPSSRPFFTDILPEFIHVGTVSSEAPALRWLIERIILERSSPLLGASIASAQLAQLLFIQVLRAHLTSSKPLQSGWLRAISDDRLSHALRLMHGDPGRAWNLRELAKASAMSRTSFAVYFKSVAGLSPLAYLTEWRMRLAQKVLREEDTSVLQLAESLGYSSESSFSNAFKRVIGTAPSRYRAAARRGPAADVGVERKEDTQEAAERRAAPLSRSQAKAHAAPADARSRLKRRTRGARPRRSAPTQA